MKEITFVVPMYNDQQSLEVLHTKIRKAKIQDVKFLIVDNGSTTPLTLPPETSDFISSIRTDQNLGFGGGVMFGFNHSHTEYVGWMPGNLKIFPEDLRKFLSLSELSPHKIIKATRINRPRGDALKTWIAGIIQSILLKRNMMDTGGTPTICHRDFLINLSNFPVDYTFESYILFRARENNMKIQRPPIRYRQRIYGTSHWQSGILTEIKLMIQIIKQSRRWK